LRDIKAIAAGESNSLVIKNDGTVWTWGRYWEKQNGIGTSKSRTEPVQIEGLFDVKAVAAGSFHSLALKNDGTVWTWGYNSSGFGDEATKSSNIPIQVKDLGDIKAIAAGGSHSLAIKNDETVWSWGDNQKGQLGDGTRDSRDIPVLSKDVTSPTNPADLTAAIEENHVVLKWQPSIDGDEVAGYEIYRDDVMIDTVNETTFIDADIEVDKAYIYKVIAFDVSGNKSEAIIVVANDILQPSKPSNIVVAKTPTTVSLEWEASTDNMWVEGYVIYRNGERVGESKDTSYVDKTVPHNSTYIYTIKAYDKSGNLSEESDAVTVTTESLTYVPLAAGGGHSLHVKSDGTVWVWGDNQYGQLGDGTSTTTATLVKDLKDIVAVAAGEDSSLVLKNDGTVWTSQNVQIKGLSDIKSIAVGRSHNLALKNDGTVWAWGSNGYGQLGDGTTKTSYTPVQVDGLKDVKAITAGKYNSIALRNDGTVWVWGYAARQLSDGMSTNSTKPVQVGELKDVKAIAAGGYHSIALRNDGTVWAWELIVKVNLETGQLKQVIHQCR